MPFRDGGLPGGDGGPPGGGDLLVVVNLPGVVNLLGVTAVVGWVWSVYKTGTVGSFQVHIRRKSTA